MKTPQTRRQHLIADALKEALAAMLDTLPAWTDQSAPPPFTASQWTAARAAARVAQNDARAAQAKEDADATAARLQTIARQATPEPTDSAQTLADRLAECARLADDPTAGDFYTRLAAIHKTATATGAAPAPNRLDDDATAHAAGTELARVLSLRHTREFPDRYNTTHGTKTAAGLARTADAILATTKPTQ